MLEKAVVDGEGELCGRATWQSPASVRKENIIVFTRNRETIKVERSRLVWPDGYAGPRTDRPDEYA
jgi:dihydrofolate reductase